MDPIKKSDINPNYYESQTNRISEERYLCFLKYFPHLFGRVQNRHVASYLEISLGTISRALSGTSSKEKDTEIKKTDSRPEKKQK